MLTFSSLYRTCYYATQPRAQSKLLTSAVVLLNPIKVSHLCWSNCPILSRCISLHLHPKSVLSLSRGHPWNGLQHGYRHVEPWLYFSRIIYGIPYLSRRERTRTAVLALSNLQLDDKPLTVNTWLVASFNLPTKNFKSVDISENFGPAPTQYINVKEIGSSTIQVTVYLRFSSPWTFKPENTITIGVNGDMSNPQEVEKTISLTHDQSGTIDIQFVDVPQALVGLEQGLTFTDGQLVVPITLKAGSPSSFAIVPSTFTVTAAELTNGNQTIVSTPQVSPSTITVEKNPQRVGQYPEVLWAQHSSDRCRKS